MWTELTRSDARIEPASRIDVRCQRRRTAQMLRRVVPVLVLTACTVLMVSRPSWAVRQLELSFVRQPTPYTELFFENPDRLPTSIPEAGVAAFSFSIRNNEIRAITYEYVCEIRTAGRTAVIDRGVALVPAGAAATRSEHILSPGAGKRFVVSISLVGRSQEIDFIGGPSR